MSAPPEGNYNSIHRNSTGFDKSYDLVACRRCGAAVHDQREYLDQHDRFHDTLLQFMQLVQAAHTR